MFSTMAVLIIALLVSYGGLTSSAPLAPNTTTSYIEWRSEPDGRGTFSILTSCLITMILCVWTALHLNIPPLAPVPDERPKWKRIWESNVGRQTRWVLMGLLAPELVVYTAWMQQRLAKRIDKSVRSRSHKVRPSRPAGISQIS